MSDNAGDDTAASAQGTEQEPKTTRAEWEDVPVDPEPTDELGYEWAELDIIKAEDNEEKLVVLPTDEEMIRNDAFMILSTDSVYDVVDMR